MKGPLLQALAGSPVPQEVEATSALDGQKVIGFYFSAHWCLPCRYFDPELIRAYEQLKARGERFQIVFVSADRSEEAFQRHMTGMPWLTIPYEDARNQLVKKHLGVDGKHIGQSGFSDINGSQPSYCRDPFIQFLLLWRPPNHKMIFVFKSAAMSERKMSFFFFYSQDGTEPGLKQGRAVLADAANKEAEKGEERDLFFYLAGEDEFSDNVRDFADLDDTCPLLIILDSPEQNVYVCSEVKVTSKTVSEFVDKFLRGELTPTPIPPLCEAVTGDDASAVTL
ncbi:unnamed protein product [Lymnaea stagnalis]|uniref:Thioredoxin domain-containing protein n=1 Tax=Lymnaea stagnalis TaxID=6523 RepID=A0AAV2H5E1_LYMST